MSKLTLELPDHIREYVGTKVSGGEYASAEEYIVWLIGQESRLTEIDRLLDEADDEYERGECVPHKGGDFIRMGEEVIQQHLEAKRS